MAIIIKKVPLEVPIHCFGKSKVDGDSSMKNLLGGKGANLCEMAKLGVPVPPGFIIPTSMCAKYVAAQGSAEKAAKFQAALLASIKRGLKFITDEKGDSLLSVRSGARVSMPGMMDTVLNVGLDDSTYPLWESKLGKECVTNCYDRLLDMFGGVVYGLKKGEFHSDSLPDAETQVVEAAMAVFKSWNNPRAIEYRKINNIPDDWGTAVTVQAMVFGNMNDNSATGVLFSRDPSTGECGTTGEFLVNAQGEDVVDGSSTPLPLTEFGPTMGAKLAQQLFSIVVDLEAHYADMQDIEFTVEDGKLYILQTRNGKRSAKAAFKIAYDMVKGGMITKEEVKSRISNDQFKAVMSSVIDPSFTTPPDLTGIAAGGSVVTGVAVLSSEDAVNCKEPCILVTKETDPNDIAGMYASVGILTATGGLTSHAAVVARGMNKSCVVGCTSLSPIPFSNGTKITIDGATGNVWVGVDVPVLSGGVTKEVVELAAIILGKENCPVSVYLDHTMDLEAMQAALSIVPSTAYIDMAPLGGTSPYSGAACESAMVTLGLALVSFPDMPCVFSFPSEEASRNPVDAIYFDMFGGDTGVSGKAYDTIAEVISAWAPHMKSRITATGDVPSLLRNSGVTVCGEVKTFADLLVAGGAVEASAETIKDVFGGQEAFDAAIVLVEGSTGKTLTGATPKGYHWYELMTGEDNAPDNNA